MGSRLGVLAFLISAFFTACKKKEPPAPPASLAAGAAASARASTPVASAKGRSLAILEDFEGQISWVAKGKFAGASKGKDLPLALLVKDGKFRLDLPPGLAGAPAGDNAYLLGHPQQGKFYAVIDLQKQVVLIDADKLGAQIEAMSGAAGASASEEAPEVLKTVKLEKVVAGHSCDPWQVTYKTSRTELCVATQEILWFQLPFTKLPAKYSWAAELTDGKHFPLYLIVFDRYAREAGRVELTGIEKKKLETASFELPAGYRVIELEQMLADLSGAFVRPPASGSIAKPSASARKQR